MARVGGNKFVSLAEQLLHYIFTSTMCTRVLHDGLQQGSTSSAFALTFFDLECFPRWSGCCFTSRAHRIRAAEMIGELREGQSYRCCCSFLLWSQTVCTCTLLHRQAQAWGRIRDERSITLLLSGMGGVFSQRKSNRLADFHSSL